MATLDISILNSVSTVVVFMLVFVGGWGMLSFVNPFKGKGESFYGIMAFLLAVMMVLSRKAVNVILFATPWLMLLFLIAFFFLFFGKFLGGDKFTIPIGEARVYGWLIFFVGVIVIFAIGNSYGQDLLNAQVPNQGTPTVVVNGTGPNGTTTTVVSGGATNYEAVNSNDFGKNLTLTLFHPKILGVLFMFILGTLAILLLNN